MGGEGREPLPPHPAHWLLDISSCSAQAIGAHVFSVSPFPPPSTPQHKGVSRKIAQYRQLYNLVRNQRNKFVNLIQASAQSIAEMKEKLKVRAERGRGGAPRGALRELVQYVVLPCRPPLLASRLNASGSPSPSSSLRPRPPQILGNEIEILLNEALQKERLLNKAVAENTVGHAERDKLRLELDRSMSLLRSKQVEVDEQIVDLERLGMVSTSVEQQMISLRQVYEAQVERRNIVGTTLIDRNDELCILYEKAHVQEEINLKGDLSLRERDDEIRLLRIEIAEVTRHRNVVRSLQPVVPQLDETIASLQQQLLQERIKTDDLAYQLESPDNLGRWRELHGHIPEQAELSVKIGYLSERINEKEALLREKSLILEEVSSLSERLRAQATEGRQETIELSTRVNHYQARIRETTRKLMATVSELSMYQALSMKIKADRDATEAEVSAASARVEAGMAPTEDALREWARQERERATVAELRSTRAVETEGPQHRSTAEARPNAYLGEDMGIPKPYGVYAPFKPTDAGATMRHIRKPEPREILI